MSTVIMLLTDTLFIDSGVDVLSEGCAFWGVDVPAWGSGVMVHLRKLTRAVLAMLGQQLLWYGGFQLLSFYCVANADCTDHAENLWKGVCEIIGGMFLWAATDSFIPGVELSAGLDLCVHKYFLRRKYNTFYVDNPATLNKW